MFFFGRNGRCFIFPPEVWFLLGHPCWQYDGKKYHRSVYLENFALIGMAPIGWFGWTISAPRLAFLFKTLRMILRQKHWNFLISSCNLQVQVEQNSKSLSKQHVIFGWGGIILTLTPFHFIDSLINHCFLTHPMMYDPKHLDPEAGSSSPISFARAKAMKRSAIWAPGSHRKH